MDIKAVAHLGRFKDIIVTLFNYGFDDLVERLDLPGKVFIEKIHKYDPSMSTAERIRRAVEDLGPTFVKFGQILSLRPDLLPGEVIVELRKLQDKVAPVDFAAVRQVVEEDLGRPLDEVFFSFEETPLAAASLSQVHRALLAGDRTAVAVKVQRPGARRIISNDLDILEAIASQLDQRLAEARLYDLPKMVRELRRSLLSELDFRREARNQRIGRANLADQAGICVPQVYEDYSSQRVLTMELIQGVRLGDLGPEADRPRLARRGLKATIKQILADGFFHADPHPGNILFLDDGVICLLDWGMIGRLSRESRFQLTDLISAIINQDSEKLVDVLLGFVGAEGTVDRRRLQTEILDILDSYLSLPLGQIDIGRLLLEMTGLLREYRLKLPGDLAIMIKALITAEGTARQLDPDLDVVTEAEPFVREMVMRRWAPGELWRRARGGLFGLQRSLGGIVAKLDRGELSLRFQHTNLAELRRSMENASNRLTLAIIIGSLVIGSSMIITTGRGPLLFGFPALGVVGYLVSGLLGLWLVFSIIRRRRF